MAFYRRVFIRLRWRSLRIEMAAPPLGASFTPPPHVYLRPRARDPPARGPHFVPCDPAGVARTLFHVSWWGVARTLFHVGLPGKKTVARTLCQ